MAASRTFKITFENLSNTYAFTGWGDPYYIVPDLRGNIKVVHTPKKTLEIQGDATTLWIEQEASTPSKYGVLVRYYNTDADIYFGIRILKAFQFIIGGAITWSTASSKHSPHTWKDQKPQASDHVWKNGDVKISAIPTIQDDDIEIAVTIADIK